MGIDERSPFRFRQQAVLNVLYERAHSSCRLYPVIHVQEI